MTNPNDTTPRIYVASLSDYNAGHLHGCWIDDLNRKDAANVQDEVNAMLRESKYPNVEVPCPEIGSTFPPCPVCKGTGKVPSAEEWAIHDHEGFGRIDVGESDSFERLVQLAELLDEHGGAFEAWYEMMDGSSYLVDEMGEKFLEAYAGTFDSTTAWAEDYIANTGFLDGASDLLKRYFDYDQFAHDAAVGGDIYTEHTNKGVVVFWNH